MIKCFNKRYVAFFVVLVFLFAGMMDGVVLAQNNVTDGGGDYDAPGRIVFGNLSRSTTPIRTNASGSGLATVDGATYITSVDNVGDGGVGAPDGDMYTGPSGATSGITTYGRSEVIEFNINVTGALPTENAVLTIFGWDVDEEQGEVNYVYFNGHFCGKMTGDNQKWNTTVFEIDKSWVQSGNNLIEYYIDQVAGSGWVSAVDWGQLLIDGGSRARADIPQIEYLSQEQSGSYTILKTKIPVEIVSGTTSDYFRLEVNFLDTNGNVVTSQSVNNISGTTGDILDQFVDIKYLTNSPSGTYWINANVFLVDGNVQQVYKKMLFNHTQNIGASQAPIMLVTGNGETIDDGSTIPAAKNNTMFGTVGVGSSIEKTFKIKNNGSADLTLTDSGSNYVAISGANASDFTLTSYPTTPLTSGGGSTTFDITFTPSEVGARVAEVSIASNDSEKNPYTFAITGGLSGEIEIVGNGNTIAKDDNEPSTEDNTDFGTIMYPGGSVSKSFKIANTGTYNLTVNNVGMNGTNYNDFSVTSSTSGTVSPGDSMDLTIEFSPSATGLRTATVTVNSDDSDESLYRFAVQGTGGEPLEINIKGNGHNIVDNDNTPSADDYTLFGSVDVDGDNTESKTYVIENTGSANLTVSSVQITGDNASDFAVTTDPSGTIGGSSSANLVVTFNPSATGVRNAIVTVNNNDSNESTYSFAIRGTGYTTGLDLTMTTNYQEANTSPGVELALGAAVHWTYIVTNTGSVALSNVAVTDDTTGLVGTITSLAAGATDSVVQNSNAISGEYKGAATAACTYNGKAVNSSDVTYYTGLPSSISGFVWHDRDRDGIKEAGEPGHQDVVVKIYDNSNALVTLDVSDAEGNYTLDELEPGDYTVEFTDLGAYFEFSPMDQGGDDTADSDVNPETGRTASISLGTDEDLTHYDAAIYLPAVTVSGLVWNDVNRDGRREHEEPLISGVKVELFDSTNTKVRHTENTNEAGKYRFDTLDFGKYHVRFFGLPEGYGFTLPKVGPGDLEDSDANEQTGATLAYMLMPGDSIMHLDAGIIEITGYISGNLFLDENANGVKDEGDAPIADEQVLLMNTAGTVVDSAMSDNGGDYRFADIEAATYKLTVNNTDLHSYYSNTTGGDTLTVTVNEGDNLNDAHFGYKQAECSLTVVLFKDDNGNGTKDAEEGPLPDVDVVLSDIEGNALFTTATDQDGNALFAQVVPGKYLVSVNTNDPDMPAAYWPTVLTNPFATEVHFDDPVITTEVGMNVVGSDPGSGGSGASGVIGDYVWHDSNWNRQPDGDEEHLPYVMLYLYRLVSPNAAQSSNGPANLVQQEVFVDSVRTNYFGTYYFTGVTDGEYIVRAHEIAYSQDQEWTITSRDSMYIHMADAEMELDADFGFAQKEEAIPGEIRVFVFDDQDYSRAYTEGEPGLADVTVDLYKKGELVASEISDASGYATFEADPGDYTIMINGESVPENYVLTTGADSEELFLAGEGEYDSEGFGFAVEASWGTTPNRIIAKYESWYDNTDNGRYWATDNLGGIADTSLIGFYNSNDADVADYHILQAWASGIDGFSVNWFGWYAFENQGLNLMLDRASALNEKYGEKGFNFEVAASLNEYAVGALDSNLTYIAESLLDHDAYWGTKREVKRPIFVDNAQETVLAPEAVKAGADTLLPMDVMLAWNGAWEDSVSSMDVCYPSMLTDRYPWNSGSEFSTEFLDSVYTRLGHLESTDQTGFVIGSVWPGYDDRQWVSGNNQFVDASDTTVYAQSWRKVLEYDQLYSIPWVMVQSWNNFNNGTAIEPGLAHQYTYNMLTRDFARQYKTPEVDPDSVGVADAGLLVPRYIYIARLAAKAYPEKAADIELQIEKAYDSFFSRDYDTAIEAANKAAGLVSPAIQDVSVENVAITLKWDAVEAANTYYIHVSTDSASFTMNSAVRADMINVGNVTEYTLAELDEQTTYYLTVTTGDSLLGDFITGWYESGNIVSAETGNTVTGIDSDDSALPKEFALEQNYPNPFNPVTNIQYALPKKQHVSVKLYNTLGQQVMTLVDSDQVAGFYNVQVNGMTLGSGVYFYRIITEDFTATRKLMLLK